MGASARQWDSRRYLSSVATASLGKSSSVPLEGPRVWVHQPGSGTVAAT
jgi:hypothetical protein